MNLLHLNSTGSGDIDTSTVVKADADCCIRGGSGMPYNKSVLNVIKKIVILKHSFNLVGFHKQDMPQNI